MRGGLLIANPAGGLASGAVKVNLTTVRPELPLDTVSDSMLLPACDSAWPTPRITMAAPRAAAPPHARQRGRFNSLVDGTGLICVAPVFGPPPRAGWCLIAPSSRRRRPAPAP